MYLVRTSSTAQIIKQLSQLLGLEISHVQLEEGDSPATVRIVSAFDSLRTRHRFVLKHQDDRTAFRFYTHYLHPFDLNSPIEYGYIDIDGQAFLVMEYVHHAVPNWSDGNGYLKAVRWLIKKDLATSQHLDTVRNLDCFGTMPYYGVPYWLSELEPWSHAYPSNSQARQVWRMIRANQTRIASSIDELNSVGVQTVVHGDLHLSNMLFGEAEFEHKIFVIDWTQPHIGSVTKDLASLYDNAPNTVKDELIHLYRNQIDFPAFDELFVKAKLLRDIGYLSWMAGMISAQAQEEIEQSEVDRVVHSIMLSLG